MLDELTCSCEAQGCDRTLGRERRMLTMTTDAGTRCAYECACGAVTITVVKQG